VPPVVIRNRAVGYYMRYYVDDERPIALEEIQAGLQEIDPAFALGDDGDLHRGDQLLAELELNLRGTERFDEELSEFLEQLEDSDEDARPRVERCLRAARAVVVARVLWQGCSTDETVDLLSPLWTWLLENRRGLIQADGEGFYEGDELILELD
jgi:hypothetical protein